MKDGDPPISASSQTEGVVCPRVMRLAVILSDWTVAEFEVTSYEVFADGALVAHFEDGGVQTFRSGEWIDIYRSRGSEMGWRDAKLGLPQDG